MNFIYLSLILILSFTASGCDKLYALLDKKGAEEKQLIGEAYAFESNPRVEEIQSLLKLYGYDIGKVDGVLGGRTRAQIERFQHDAGLDPTRFVDQQTWSKLNELRECQLVIDQKLNIKLIQQALKNAGYSVGAIDGAWGKRTKETVAKFQKAHGLTSDGKVGYKTLSQLARYLPHS